MPTEDYTYLSTISISSNQEEREELSQCCTFVRLTNGQSLK